MQNNLLTIAKSLLKCPTAPFRESAVQKYILDFCRQRGIGTTVDAMGNILAHYGRQSSNPLVFVAHTDHPGFIIEKDSVNNQTTAVFHGGVEKEYFRKNTGICIFTANGPVKGKILKIHFDVKKRKKRVWLLVRKRCQ